MALFPEVDLRSQYWKGRVRVSASHICFWIQRRQQSKYKQQITKKNYLNLIMSFIILWYCITSRKQECDDYQAFLRKHQQKRE